jgi:hypothetical protein
MHQQEAAGRHHRAGVVRHLLQPAGGIVREPGSRRFAGMERGAYEQEAARTNQPPHGSVRNTAIAFAERIAIIRP